MARTTIQGSFLGLASQAAGDVMYFNGTNWIRLAKGSADEVLTMNNGATAPEWEVAGGGGATVREGGNTDGSGSYQTNGIEATTNSTSAVDLLSASSLTIAAAQSFKVTIVARKTTGAAAQALIGFKENSTVVWEADITKQGLWRGGTSNLAVNGTADFNVSSRVPNYVNGKVNGLEISYSAAGAYANRGQTLAYASNYVMSTDAITSFTIRGVVGDTDISLGLDEYHIYSWAAS